MSDLTSEFDKWFEKYCEDEQEPADEMHRLKLKSALMKAWCAGIDAAAAALNIPLNGEDDEDGDDGE